MSNMSIETLETMMSVTVYVFAFLFGICIGSFLNVCIYRLPKGESLVKSNSHCMTCGAEIKRYDLIPVLSWLILGGKCRACGAKITPRYMLVESLTGLMFLFIFMRFDWTYFGIYPAVLCLFVSTLIVLCFQDIDNREMCVSVLVTEFLFAAAARAMSFIRVTWLPGKYLLVFPEQPDALSALKDGAVGMLAVSLPILIIGFVITPFFYNAFISEERKSLRKIKTELESASKDSRNYIKLTARKEELEKQIKEEPPVFGFGMGDVILMAAGGLMLGLKATVTAGVIAVITGAVYGVAVKAIRGVTDDDSDNAFAFGPFLIIGLCVGMFTGGSLADMYLGLMGIR